MRILALAGLAILCLATDAFSQVTVVNNRGLLGRRSNIVQVGGGFIAPQRIAVAPQRIVVAPQRVIVPRQRLLIAPLRVHHVQQVQQVQVQHVQQVQVQHVQQVQVQHVQQVQQVHQVQQQILVGHRRLQLNQLNTFGYTPYNSVQNIQPQVSYIQAPQVQLVQAPQVQVVPQPMVAPQVAPQPMVAPVAPAPQAVVDPFPPQQVVQQVVQQAYYYRTPQYVVVPSQRLFISQCH